MSSYGRRCQHKNWRFYLLACLFFSATFAIADGLLIVMKAQLAQQLIGYAWEQSLRTGLNVKPWPWADTWPVAKLQSEQLANDLYILKGAQGNALAFGPGWLDESVQPNQPGTKIVAAHRDTHFRFLHRLKNNDVLTLINKQGLSARYLVESTEVMDSVNEQLVVDKQLEQLLLITCYPFDAIEAGGPQRYIVRAMPEKLNNDEER
ncbi:class GN sortase [Oceanicoccus sp. KOV_DT_Chl]|uniref:class GN sortase n=1 Tax=Oceanicoccus sp. KOV_DT_Chl TaxID=1904639 RepID=UPI000C7A0C20|nr:class GN sortase [Oceanicoccus sp. KOV_DT_Chl]